MGISGSFLNGKAERLERGFELSERKEGFLLKGHAPLYREFVYNSGIMDSPIQFPSQEAFEQAVGTFLRDKLSFEVSSRSDSGDVGCGEYVEMKTYRISVQLDGEAFTAFDLN